MTLNANFLRFALIINCQLSIVNYLCKAVLAFAGILIFLFPAPIAAQEPITDNDLLSTILTDIASQNEEEQDLEQLLEILEDLAENPIYINDATFEDVARITWLTEFQVKSLLEHVKKRGPMQSHYEIASLYGFTPELAQTLVPFISLEKKPEMGVADRKSVV